MTDAPQTTRAKSSSSPLPQLGVLMLLGMALVAIPVIGWRLMQPRAQPRRAAALPAARFAPRPTAAVPFTPATPGAAFAERTAAPAASPPRVFAPVFRSRAAPVVAAGQTASAPTITPLPPLAVQPLAVRPAPVSAAASNPPAGTGPLAPLQRLQNDLKTLDAAVWRVKSRRRNTVLETAAMPQPLDNDYQAPNAAIPRNDPQNAVRGMADAMLTRVALEAHPAQFDPNLQPVVNEIAAEMRTYLQIVADHANQSGGDDSDSARYQSAAAAHLSRSQSLLSQVQNRSATAP